jgi:hypothetical protein
MNHSAVNYSVKNSPCLVSIVHGDAVLILTGDILSVKQPWELPKAALCSADGTSIPPVSSSYAGTSGYQDTHPERAEIGAEPEVHREGSGVASYFL